MSEEFDREEAKQLSRAAAWDEGVKCPTCPDGLLPTGGRMLIHTTMGGFGADWDLESVLATIDNADQISWVRSFMGHDLRAVVDGKAVAFQVARPGSDGAL